MTTYRRDTPAEAAERRMMHALFDAELRQIRADVARDAARTEHAADREAAPDNDGAS